MAMKKTKCRVVVAGASDKIFSLITDLLPPSEYDPALRVNDAGELRRTLISDDMDIVIINAPLPDEFGIDLALDLADSTMGVLLFVKNEIYDQVCYKVESNGVLTLGKPNTRQAVSSAIRIMTAISARLKKMDRKNKTLQEKMADIRTVNRAKWLLIENLNMTEKEAHYYIEKQSMDTRCSRREIAEGIIRTYDK